MRGRGIAMITLLVCGLTPAAVGQEGESLCFGNEPTIVGTPGDDNLVGTQYTDVIDGLGGNDVIHIGEGMASDLACGGAGDDRIVNGTTSHGQANGGPGNDVIEGVQWLGFEGAPGPVTVDLAAGTATGYGSDRITGVIGLEGTRYSDTILGDEHDNFFRAGNGELGRGAADYIDGRAGNDVIEANGFGAHLLGGSGDDQICGVIGMTEIDGGEGNDRIAISRDPDDDGKTIDGGAGSDWIVGSSGGVNCYAELGAAHFDLAAQTVTPLETSSGAERTYPIKSFENVYGSSRSDVIVGDDGPNILLGHGRDDTVRGGGGDDVLGGRWGEDSLSGGPGNDHLRGGRGPDDLDGGSGADSIQGGSGSDRCTDGEDVSGCE